MLYATFKTQEVQTYWIFKLMNMIFYLKKVLACLNRSLYDEDKEMSNLSMIK